MSDRISRQLEIFFEGEQGHQGNVLATTFLVKFHKLVNLLHRLERLYSGAKSRKTEFEIVTAKKYNPTVLALKPVPKVKDYSPAEAFDWSIEQLNAVANDLPTDERLDFQALQELSEIASPPKDGAYRSFWFEAGRVKVYFNQDLAEKALRAATKAHGETVGFAWHEGVSYGDVTGDLRAVLDENGEQEFIIHPPVGPERIVCKFPEQKRNEMNHFLFKVVTVSGKLHYAKTSPHPYLVEMESIEAKAAQSSNLLDLRGLFKGLDAARDGGLTLFDA